MDGIKRATDVMLAGKVRSFMQGAIGTSCHCGLLVGLCGGRLWRRWERLCREPQSIWC